MSELFFEDVEVGDELPPLRPQLDGEAVRRYALAANMPGGRFLSDEAARAEGLPGQIVPGNMSLALFSKMLTDWGEGVTVKRISATFRRLVHPRTPLTIHGVVTEKRDDVGLVECDLILENQEGERLVTGTATVQLPRRS